MERERGLLLRLRMENRTLMEKITAISERNTAALSELTRDDSAGKFVIFRENKPDIMNIELKNRLKSKKKKLREKRKTIKEKDQRIQDLEGQLEKKKRLATPGKSEKAKRTRDENTRSALQTRKN